MQKQLQKKQELSYSENVLDIVQFGSSVILETKPNDIDIAVLFKTIPLRQQLEEAQMIKKQLEKRFNLPIHINSYDLYSFFSEGNFAKENILFYGKSIINENYFSKKLGLTPKIHISYILKDLLKKEKVKFNYLLNGKAGDYGLLRKYNGKLIKPGLIEINPEYEDIFINAIKEITNNFQINKVFKQ